MSFRTNLLKTVVKLRELPGPTRFDVYTSRVTVRRRQWSGGQIQNGTPIDTDLELKPRPKVRELDGDKLLQVGPITPKNEAGGYTPQQLNQGDIEGLQFYYVITMPDGTEKPYRLKSIDTGKAFSYYLVLETLYRKFPF